MACHSNLECYNTEECKTCPAGPNRPWPTPPLLRPGTYIWRGKQVTLTEASITRMTDDYMARR